MVITPQLRKLLATLGVHDQEFNWLESPDQRTKGAITLEMPMDERAAALKLLRQLPHYQFTEIEGVLPGEGKKFLGLLIEVSVPFVRGFYRCDSGLYDCRSLVTLPDSELQVVMWRSAYVAQEGVLSYVDWVEALMHGDLKLSSAY